MKHYPWRILDSLREDRLDQRGRELVELLVLCSDKVLIEFHKCTVQCYKAFFTKKMVQMFALAFYGEANDSGFVDFCTNVILRGSQDYRMLMGKPDAILEIDSFQDLNEDWGINISEVAFDVLEERHGEEEAIGLLTKSLGKDAFMHQTCWDELRVQTGGRLLAIETEYAKVQMPRLLAKADL